MNDFVANNMKYIVEWGRPVLWAIIITAIFFLYLIERRYRAYYPKRILTFFASVLLITLVLISSYAMVSVVNLNSRFTEIIDGLEGIKGKKAGELAFNLVVNDSVKNIEEYHGDVVLLNYWATWCPPCVQEIADLNKLQDAYAEKGVTIIAISNEEREQLVEFNKKHPFDVVSGYLDHFNWVDMGSARPITFLINKEGIVEDYFTGSFNYEFFESQIQKYLK